MDALKSSIACSQWSVYLGARLGNNPAQVRSRHGSKVHIEITCQSLHIPAAMVSDLHSDQ
jgi:hypothetical protein